MRKGVSLLEVLISTFVLSIGMLGLAALLPVGQYTIAEAAKADRSAACGRAAMRDITIRRMLDYRFWNPMPSDNQTTVTPFFIDPIGRGHGLGNNLGPMDRVNLSYIKNLEAARSVFGWRDDVTFTETRPEEGRPEGYFDHYTSDFLSAWTDKKPTGSPINLPSPTGHYTWLATVTPVAAERDVPMYLKRRFEVSVAVCFQRSFVTKDSGDRPYGEEQRQGTFLTGGPIAYGGGAFQLDNNEVLYVRENEWVLLTDGVQCHWYRVVSAGDRPTNLLMLAGPDWIGKQAICVVIQSVVGVYTTTIELDNDPLWTRY